MNCDPYDHDFVPIVEERDKEGVNWFVSRYCRKCGMVTDDRKMYLKAARFLPHNDAFLASLPKGEEATR